MLLLSKSEVLSMCALKAEAAEGKLANDASTTEADGAPTPLQ